jgi:mannitol/fructose-specific phosphotransferase system IIA component (Ntr-type)
MKNTRALVIADLLQPAAMQLELQSLDRETLLAELVNYVPELASQPDARATLLRALHEREQLHSTCVGDGVAFPHARNALVGLVDHPILVFGRHRKGIQFGALDAMPAQLFFLVVAPTVTQHLGILARLSRLVRNPKLRQALLTAQTPTQVAALVREAETGL